MFDKDVFQNDFMGSVSFTPEEIEEFSKVYHVPFLIFRFIFFVFFCFKLVFYLDRNQRHGIS